MKTVILGLNHEKGDTEIRPSCNRIIGSLREIYAGLPSDTSETMQRSVRDAIAIFKSIEAKLQKLEGE